MRAFRLLLAAAGVLALAGCSRLPYLRSAFPDVPVSPPKGFVFTSVKAPLDFDFSGAEGTPAGPDLGHGEAAAHYLWLPYSSTANIAWGKGAIERAAKDGKIEEIYFADYQQTSILLVYSHVNVIVYGRVREPADASRR